MSDTTNTHTETAKPGMPQLDPTYFASQLFWLAVTFVAMYVVMSRIVIPSISRVIERRETKIAADIAAAQSAKSEAQAAISAYEKEHIAARDASNAAIAAAQQTINDKVTKETAEIDAKLATDISRAEQQIAVKSREARETLKPVAIAVATQMVEQVLGLKASASTIEAAISSQLKD